jgi:hypothetical protein
VITLALDGLPFRRPGFSAESIGMTRRWGPDYLGAAVAPVFEMARQCLMVRFPGWTVEIRVPSDDGGTNGDCRMTVATLTKKNTLRFFTESLQEGARICCESGTDGDTIRRKQLEVIPRTGGQFTKTEALEETVGEFLHEFIRTSLTELHAVWEARDALLPNLAQLRANAILVMNTSGGKAVSEDDVARLESLAAGLFGVSLDRVNFLPAEGSPHLDVEIADLRYLLPDEAAAAGREFLTNLQQRVVAWLT